MHDIISIGSSLVDIFIASKSFQIKGAEQGILLCQQYGDKTEVESLEVCTGGGGSNTAVGFSRMGFSTAVISETGTDAWSELIINDLEKEKVDTSLIISEKKEQTGGSVILVSSDGGRTVMVHRGAASMLDPRDIPEQALAETKAIYLSSIAGRLETLKKIFSIARDSKTKLFWNPGKAEIKLLTEGKFKVSETYFEVLFVNRKEWEMLSSVQNKLQQQAKIVVVTNGKQGGQVLQEGKSQTYQVDHVKTVEETGAGDSFAVGFVSAYLLDKDVAKCIEWGKKNSTSVVGYTGAKKGLLTRDKIV